MLFLRDEGAGGFGVGVERRNGDEFAFGVAQSGERSAKNAARIDVDGAVEPFRFGNGGVPVDDGRRAAILGCPVVAHRQAELVGFSGGFAVEGELAHRAGGASCHALLHPGVGDDQLAVIEQVMAGEIVDEIGDLRAKFRRLVRQLRQRLRQAVLNLHIFAAQCFDEFDVVVAGDAEGRSGGDHAHDQLERLRDFRAAIHQIAQKDGFASGGRIGAEIVGIDGIAQLREQQDKFVIAAVNVADDVEGAMLGAAVVPERFARDDGAGDFVFAVQDGNAAEAFALQAAQRALEVAALTLDDLNAEIAVGALLVALEADALRHVEDDGDWQRVIFAGEGDERLARLRLDVGGVDDGELHAGEALGGDVVEHGESVVGGGLIVLVVGDESPAEIRRDDLGGAEVRPREGRFAAARRADQHDEREIRDGEVHQSPVTDFINLSVSITDINLSKRSDIFAS